MKFAVNNFVATSSQWK